jgi:glycosyltransferase involved in cell wall biosynthesis
MHLPRRHGRIVVVPLGADHLASSSDRAGSSGIDGPYLLTLSGIQHHKNIPRLIQAFHRIADRVPHKLVIAGIVPPDVVSAVSETKLGTRLQWTGYVSDERLASLFAGAALFVFPSWHEGFGLPLLEAQRFGTPVAAASIPALVEIANGTAELFDPFSDESIAAAILRVVQKQQALAEAGRRNAAAYTWEAAARATLGIYEEVVASGRRGSSSR